MSFIEQQKQRTLEMRQREENMYAKCRIEAFARSIPPSFRSWTLDAYREENGRDTVAMKLESFLLNPSQFLLFTGSIGAGKTAMSIATARALLGTGKYASATYVDMGSFLTTISTGYGVVPQDYLSTQILILDDLGAGSQEFTPSMKRAIFQLFDHRWSNPGLVTILTTNLGIQGIRNMLTGPVWDRVGSSMMVVPMSGDSRRGK